MTRLTLALVSAMGAIAIGAQPPRKPEAPVAAKAPIAIRPSNAILSANYRCRLEGDDLVGSAEWSIRNSGAIPQYLSLDPLSLAIRRAHWIDKRPAVIALKPGAASSELLVERTDDRQIQFEWSARGSRDPGGLRLLIRTPASPIAVMKLELPADLQPRLKADQAILTGPTIDNGRFVWTIAFGGLETLDLQLVRRDAGERLPIMISGQRGRHTIAVGQITSEFTVDLESFHRGIRELKIRCDPGFEPTEVTARDLADWHFASLGELTLTWLEPFRRGAIVIRGIGSPPASRDWSIPGLTVVGAARMSETLTLQSAPELLLSDCRPGLFRIVEFVAPPDRAGSSIVLQSGIFQNTDRRPTVRISVADAAFRTHERLWWRLDGTNESLVAQISVESLHSAIAESRWRLPRNFTVDRVDAGQPDVLGGWRVVDDILIVDWLRPLSVGRMGRLTIQLTTRAREPNAAMDSIDFPDLVPLGSTQRTGLMAIKTPLNARAITESASVAPPAADLREFSPWGPADPDLVLPLRPGNRIQLQSRPSGFGCAAICRLSPTLDSILATYRLHIEPHETPLSKLLLRFPRGCDALGDWRVVQGRATIRSVDRLDVPTAFLGLAATHSLWLAVIPAAIHDEWSQISLTSPVAEPFDLECRCALPSRQIPLFEIVGSLDSAWQTTIDGSGSQWDARSASGRPLWRTSDSNGRRAFRSEPDVLTVFSRSTFAPIFDDTRLTVDASQLGRLSYSLSFGVSDWRRGELPLILPEGARSVAVAINGMTATIEPIKLADGRLRIELPARTAERWTTEIRYTTAADAGRFWGHLTARLPAGDFDFPPPRIEWILPPGWSPTRPTRLVEATASASPNGSVEGATRWIVADAAPASAIEMMRPPEIQRLCLAIAALLFCCCGLADIRWAARVGVVVGGLLAFTAMWLPTPWRQFCWSPLVACAILILRPHVAKLVRGRIPIVGRPKMGAATALGLLAVIGWSAVGGAAVPLAHDPVASGAMPIRAEFVGVVNGSEVEFTAHIAAFVSSDQPTSLKLPWTGLQLRTASLDGQSVAGSVANNEATIPVMGRGWHEFTITFTAECRGHDERQIDFPIAEVCDCALTVRAPKPALNLDALTRHGAARVTSELDFERLDADLGRVDRLRVRWNRAATAAATIQSDEAYLWILEELSARLIGNVTARITGAAAQLQLALPDKTMVKSVSARPVEGGGQDRSSWLQDWKLDSETNSNRLTLGFSRPISGQWQIEFELVPTAPLSSDFTLRFPQLHAATSRAVCAWRASSVNLEEVDHGDLSPIAPGDYRAEHVALPLSDSDRAYRRTAAAHSSGVRLRLVPDRPAVGSNPEFEPRPTPVGQDRHTASSRKAAVAEPEYRMAGLDYVSVEIGDGAWVHQLTAQVDAAAPMSLALAWFQSVEVLSLAVDDETLVMPERANSRIVVPLEHSRLSGNLVCTWRTQENHGQIRTSLPRFESARRSVAIDTANWRILPLPGRTIEGAPAITVDSGRNSPRSVAARQLFVDRFADRSRLVWTVSGHPATVAIRDPAAADNAMPAMRTGLLLAFLTAVAAFSWYVRPLEAFETIAALALVAAILRWEWPWLLPTAFVMALRAANVVFSRRFAPRSVA